MYVDKHLVQKPSLLLTHFQNLPHLISVSGERKRERESMCGLACITSNISLFPHAHGGMKILNAIILKQVLEQILGVLIKLVKDLKLDHQHKYVSDYYSINSTFFVSKD